MAKQITIETVLAAINEGEALGSDVKGTLEGDKIALVDEGRACGHIAVIDGKLDMSGVDMFLMAFCFGKAKEWILAALA